jgi:hypothetical protein
MVIALGADSQKRINLVEMFVQIVSVCTKSKFNFELTGRNVQLANNISVAGPLPMTGKLPVATPRTLITFLYNRYIHIVEIYLT